MNDWTPIAKDYDPLKAGSIDGTDEEPHDRAVLRAMMARYAPKKDIVSDPLLTLFVARLSQQTTEEKLKEFFSRYGDIQRIKLVRDIITGFSKGYAFIEYKQESAIKKAYRDANKLIIDQHEIFVDYELERELKGWIPRRLGGGFGGKKESGQLRFGGRDRPFRKPFNLPSYPINVRTEGYVDKRHRSRSRERHQDWREKKTDFSRDRGTEGRWHDRSRNRHNQEQSGERRYKVEQSRDRERGEKAKRRLDNKRDKSTERDFRK